MGQFKILPIELSDPVFKILPFAFVDLFVVVHTFFPDSNENIGGIYFPKYLPYGTLVLQAVLTVMFVIHMMQLAS